MRDSILHDDIRQDNLRVIHIIIRSPDRNRELCAALALIFRAVCQRGEISCKIGYHVSEEQLLDGGVAVC